MYLPKVYDPAAHAYRVRYAIANILRDRVANEGAFNTCFEMDDADEVITAILRRGLKNPMLRAALERSHLIDLTHWLASRPEYSEAYHAEQVQQLEPLGIRRKKERKRTGRNTGSVRKTPTSPHARRTA